MGGQGRLESAVDKRQLATVRLGMHEKRETRRGAACLHILLSRIKVFR
jgi:hypothetical protein